MMDPSCSEPFRSSATVDKMPLFADIGIDFPFFGADVSEASRWEPS